MTPNTAADRRVLVVAPTGKDARNSVNVLHEAGFQAQALGTIAAAVEESRRGCGALLLTEEALPPVQRHLLATMLANRLPRSEPPRRKA